MGKINVLSFAVANLIAAGEVVDRPSSVIKELLENSIDSGATQITIEIKNGGSTYMRVSDNGCGIEADDLPIAIKRHATSKIKTSEDLMSILTLGFRGEALAAIASVSELRIISKTADSEFGAMIESHGGEIVEYSEQAARNGTTVIVENLFANLPARRKFLKRDATEGIAIGTIIEKIALSHPEIAFRFISDGNVRLETPGDGKLENVIYIIMGRQMQNAMIYVDSEINDIRVTGYIGRSDVVKSNRNFQNFYINNRFIKSKLAIAAIEQAYTSYLPPEKFPCCVLNLTINPTTVDINVHPTKLEVKFANEKPVFEAIYHTVKSALEENITRPEIKIGDPSFEEPPARMSAQQYRSIAEARPVSQAFAPIVNSRAEEKVEQIRYTDVELPAPESNLPKAEINFPKAEINLPKSDIEEDPLATTLLNLPPLEIQQELLPPYPTRKNEDGSAPLTQSESREPEPYRPGISDEDKEFFLSRYEDITFNDKVEDYTLEEIIKFFALFLDYYLDPTTAYLNDEEHDPEYDYDWSIYTIDDDGNVTRITPIPEYRIIGEAFNSYVIVELEDKMLIIDKHAAHERIIFENNKKMMLEKEPSSQILISPIEIMLTSSEIALINDYLSEFEKLGFKLQTKKYSILVSSIPTELANCDVQDTIESMVGRIKDGMGDPKLTRDILFEKALYQASCKAAIKAGREYVDAHIEWIVEQLMNIPDITFCPHGRPVAMELSKKNLDYQFERS